MRLAVVYMVLELVLIPLLFFFSALATHWLACVASEAAGLRLGYRLVLP